MQLEQMEAPARALYEAKGAIASNRPVNAESIYLSLLDPYTPQTLTSYSTAVLHLSLFYRRQGHYDMALVLYSSFRQTLEAGPPPDCRCSLGAKQAAKVLQAEALLFSKMGDMGGAKLLIEQAATYDSSVLSKWKVFR